MPGKQALLIGINYVNTPSSRLRGCANDVQNMKQFLKSKLGFADNEIEDYVDEIETQRHATTAKGIVQHLNQLAVASWRKQLDMVFFHYSGHGTSIRDFSGDEIDGKDEAIVPSDYNVSGMISDDYLSQIFRGFNPKTKVVCVFDCCHSGTICDLKYKAISRDSKNQVVCNRDMPSNVIMISGCRDDQTSADAFNVQNQHKFTGALSSCIIMGWDESCQKDIFCFLDKLRALLRQKGFSQVPQICSSREISDDTCFF